MELVDDLAITLAHVNLRSYFLLDRRTQKVKTLLRLLPKFSANCTHDYAITVTDFITNS